MDDEHEHDRLQQRVDEISERTEDVHAQLQQVWVALQGVAGLDGVARGMADVVGVLQPLLNLAPATVARSLDPDTEDAVLEIRRSLGLAGDPRQQRLPYRENALDLGDRPVPFIGEPHPRRHPAPAQTAFPMRAADTDDEEDQP